MGGKSGLRHIDHITKRVQIAITNMWIASIAVYYINGGRGSRKEGQLRHAEVDTTTVHWRHVEHESA